MNIYLFCVLLYTVTSVKNKLETRGLGQNQDIILHLRRLVYDSKTCILRTFDALLTLRFVGKISQNIVRFEKNPKIKCHLSL